jgi:hypothetical protein
MGCMTFDQRKQLILAAWVATITIIGVVFAVDKPELWIVIAGFALAPTVIANWFWNAPPPTLSQLISAARSRS